MWKSQAHCHSPTSSSLKAGSTFCFVCLFFSLTPKGNPPKIMEWTNSKHQKEKLPWFALMIWVNFEEVTNFNQTGPELIFLSEYLLKGLRKLYSVLGELSLEGLNFWQSWLCVTFKEGNMSAFVTAGFACQGEVLSYQGVSSVCQPLSWKIWWQDF